MNDADDDNDNLRFAILCAALQQRATTLLLGELGSVAAFKGTKSKSRIYLPVFIIDIVHKYP